MSFTLTSPRSRGRRGTGKGHALPNRIEHAPAGNAVKVGGQCLPRQGGKLLPGKLEGVFHKAGNLQAPLPQIDFGRRPFGEYGELLSQKLARRNPVGKPLIPLPFRIRLAKPLHARLQVDLGHRSPFFLSYP